jgi:uncharacterized protein YndB with AHSA1/START domain
MEKLTVSVLLEMPLEQVWNHWTQAQHVQNWNFASPDWHCPKASNDLKVGGEFHYTMAAKDGSFEFDFWGTYTQIEPHSALHIVLGDGRHMQVLFEPQGNVTLLTEHFEPENMNPHELQVTGWQSILNQFKRYVEGE